MAAPVNERVENAMRRRPGGRVIASVNVIGSGGAT
jgi:hypothetical protein